MKRKMIFQDYIKIILQFLMIFFNILHHNFMHSWKTSITLKKWRFSQEWFFGNGEVYDSFFTWAYNKKFSEIAQLYEILICRLEIKAFNIPVFGSNLGWKIHFVITWVLHWIHFAIVYVSWISKNTGQFSSLYLKPVIIYGRPVYIWFSVSWSRK